MFSRIVYRLSGLALLVGSLLVVVCVIMQLVVFPHGTLDRSSSPLWQPIILLTLLAYVWCLIARELDIGMRGKWLGFVALFVNFAVLKQAGYYPVLTDVPAYALGALTLLFYLKRSTIGLAILGSLTTNLFTSNLQANMPPALQGVVSPSQLAQNVGNPSGTGSGLPSGLQQALSQFGPQQAAQLLQQLVEPVLQTLLILTQVAQLLLLALPALTVAPRILALLEGLVAQLLLLADHVAEFVQRLLHVAVAGLAGLGHLQVFQHLLQLLE